MFSDSTIEKDKSIFLVEVLDTLETCKILGNRLRYKHPRVKFLSLRQDASAKCEGAKHRGRTHGFAKMNMLILFSIFTHTRCWLKGQPFQLH